MRLIDADAAKEDFKSAAERPEEKVLALIFGEWLDDMPTIDPVKHGRWIVDYGACEPDYMECSCCNWITEYYGGLEEEWNYCPNCGATMMEGRADDER